MNLLLVTLAAAAASDPEWLAPRNATVPLAADAPFRRRSPRPRDRAQDAVGHRAFSLVQPRQVAPQPEREQRRGGRGGRRARPRTRPTRRSGATSSGRRSRTASRTRASARRSSRSASAPSKAAAASGSAARGVVVDRMLEHRKRLRDTGGRQASSGALSHVHQSYYLRSDV